MNGRREQASGAGVPLADILAALGRVQRSRLPRMWARVKPGELTLLRALADGLRAELDSGGGGKHRLT